MVFESLVVDVLNKFLGDYVVNLDSNQLKLGIWGGDVVLKNLEIKENAISQLDVPFKVKAGHISKLDLKIPWKNIYSQPVEATLDGVYLLIVPVASKIKINLKVFIEKKKKKKKKIQECKEKSARKEKPKAEKQDTFAEKLITQVIKNLQVKISNIHVRYEDDITNHNCPLSFGVSLENLSLQTADQNWNPCLHDETAKLFYKLVRLDSLFAYWNVNSELYYYSSSDEALRFLRHGVATNNMIPEDYECIFRPISAKAKLRMNPRADFDFSSPKMNLEVNLLEIAIELNRPQYLSIMELLESIDMMSRNLPYRKYRPTIPLHCNAVTWWNYAITGILEVNIKPQLHMWSWAHIRKHRQQVKKYKEMYKSKITTKKPNQDLLNSLEMLESTLDIFNITLARQQAEVEATKSGLKIYLPGMKDEEESSGGWFGWVWGWSEEKKEKKQETKSGGLGEWMTPEEKAKLYAAIGYSETAVDPTLPITYVAMKLSVCLSSMYVSIKEEKGKPEIIKLSVMDLSTSLAQRPGAQAIKFQAKVNTFEVTGLTQNKIKSCLLSSRNIVLESKDPLLSIMFETNPLDESPDQKLRVESLPLEIIYDARTVNSLSDFFRPPEDVHLEQLTSATLMKLEEFRDKTSTGLMYIIETQKVLDLKINLMASYVIVPHNGFYDSATSFLLLDLGHLKVTSKSRSILPKLKIGETSIEDIMSRAYDSFDVQLNSIQLLYSKQNENWKEARRLKYSSQHILEPMELKVEFSRAMVVTDARMPKFKLCGELPLLSVRISDEKLQGVMALIESIPKPESRPAPAAPPQKILQTQKSPPMSTPQMGLRSSALIQLQSSILFESESEEEFYDAPSSPVEDMPFFEALGGSLKRTDSIKKKRLQRQESVKNMTEFQLRFEVTEVSLQLCRLSDQTEKPVLHLEVLGLGTELNLKTFDMSSNAFLREISLKCPEYMDAESKPVYIITTLDNAEDDLLTLEYVKADKNAPEFRTTYKNTEQLLKVNFSSLDVHLHTEALLSTMNFLNGLLPTSESKVTSEDQTPAIEEKKEEAQSPKKAASKKSKFEDVINLHICAELTCLRLFIRDQKCRISEISIEGLDSEVVLRKTANEVLAKLRNIVVLDLDEKALYKKAVSITEKEVFSFKMVSYVGATEDAAYTDMNVVDSCITLTVGCIQVIFVKKFVSSILTFVNNFQAAKEAVTEATVQAAEKAATGVKELAERSSRMALDVHVNAPVVVIPQSAVSNNVLVADFGLITVKNEFSMCLSKAKASLPPVIDAMKIKLSQMKIYRTTFENNSFQSELQLLRPLNLEVVVERNLAAAWYHEIPNIKIIGTLKPMKLVLSQEDLTIVLKMLNENLGDDSGTTLPNVPTDKAANGSEDDTHSASQHSGGTTVVTAAVVEAHTPAKVKTTLKLDFQFDSLSLELYSPNSNQIQVLDQRDVLLKLAEFRLDMISTAVTMLSDGSMKASVKLANCRLDDERRAVEKATPRMLEMKPGFEKNVMVDVSYRQGKDGTVLDTVLRDLYLCASVEFLLTVADVFIKANEQSSATQRNKQQVTTTTTKGQAAAPPASKMEMNIQVKNPEIVFVADLTRADAPALVVTTQCELCISNSSEGQQMATAVEDLTVIACPFLQEKRQGNITTVLQPCDLFFRSIQSTSNPQTMELSIKSLTLKVSPVIINTVITITSALFPAAETPQVQMSTIPPDLWTKKNVKDLKMWFLEGSNGNDSEDKNKSVVQLVPNGETLKMAIESIRVTVEAGVGHRTVPMMQAKSAFSGNVKNWSTLINLQCQMNLEVHYYNEILGEWEPLLEPLEDEKNDSFRPWTLGIKMKKKATKPPSDADKEEENLKVPQYKTVINVSSKDQLNITLSKRGVVMLNNLGNAFTEAASKTADVFQKDQAPFIVKNALGLPVVVSPSDSFTVLGVDNGEEKYEVNDGDSLNMDYLQAVNEQDQFSASIFSSRQFYIQLTPQGHSTSEKISLTKLGCHLYSVTHKESGVQRSIICQIDTVKGSKVITIHSPLQIRNHFSIAFHVYEDAKLLGSALPGEEFSVPLSSYRFSICFQPVSENNELFEKCEKISFEEIMENAGKLLQKKCQYSGLGEQSLVINIVSMQDTLTSSFIEDRLDTPYVMHLWPTLLLRNLLPYAIIYSLEENGNQTTTLEDGHSAQIHTAVVDQSKLELELLNYLDQNWKAQYNIQSSNQEEICFITFTSVNQEEKGELNIAVHVSHTVGQVILALHSPYWMVNKTERMLQYKADDIHRKHPLDYKKPLLFSFKPKNFFQNNKIQLMVSDSELSDQFSMDTVGSHGAVKCKGQKKDYQVGVKIDTTSFNLTRIVTFTPFYMVANRTKYTIQVAEEGKEKWTLIELNQSIPFWPIKDSSKLLLKVEDCQMPPKMINFNRQENCLLIQLDNKLGGIVVDINQSEHSTIITFSDYHEGAAPFLIINHTKTKIIEYHQSATKLKEDSLDPGKAVFYTWPDPSGSRKLSWKCGKNKGELSQEQDELREFTSDEEEKIYLASFFEGLQRVVLFTEDETVFNVTKEFEKAELAEQEIIMSLQNMGISLVNNDTKQEVSYIGITSSDTVWEMKPKKKARWKPMSIRQTEELEKAYRDYMDASCQEDKDIEIDSNFQCRPLYSRTRHIFLANVHIHKIGVLRVPCHATKTQDSKQMRQSLLHEIYSLYFLQIQNQLPGAIFPFVFYPIKPPKSVALDSALKPLADVSIVQRSAGHSELSRIKYFMVLIQEMDLKLDLGFLYALSELFMQANADAVSTEQEVELFKKDIDYIETELMTVSSTDTSQISLYEYFHISPVKLHLSLSLSTGGEDGNKEERDREVIPVQSLNLLLKSIGATLTDVHDVVFKLAFFQRTYQFYTAQQFQWEVIRHYSKQAIKQMYVLVLGLDVLGNPFGFFRDLSEGVEAFFYEPYQGAIQGPEEFVEGMALGVKALVGGAVGGLAGAASRITGAMAKGVAAITLDEDFQQKRREAMNKQPSGLKEGLARGGKGLVSGFVSGITGIVTKPIKGAQKEGAIGFIKGVGKGLVGAVARPTGGIIDMASSTFQGIKRATESSEEVESLRPPRFIHEDGVIRPYRFREGIGSQMLQKIENGRFAKFRYFAHAMVNNTDLFMITKSGVFFVTKGTFGQLTCEWQYCFEEFTKDPFIIDGRRLRIEAKERVKSVFHAKDFGKIINFRTSDDAKWAIAKLEEARDNHPKC
uniref:Vacuolar protein sorting 13 homolog A n=1 Tax=Latimeria chalumnae TaxID=7897 RepID=H3AXY1_LATCH